ncbi:NAD(P) transhydrogenase subunit alpha [Blastopirellula marina]|uniref:proton-translocating NAD(P)(+) transhydrogenase n=1 Tax=Blastopirellula marina DSM 3645 TaxID=314230 RepID=A3ZYM8_9BACT|nr:NAD(P) transhydrogenase subunit alpha [Blastopirellula marina]EAQ78455.1 nicotinamide nucleotide transhydrogenase, subunit alpha [Blastopirellula marina DSM 3645]
MKWLMLLLLILGSAASATAQDAAPPKTDEKPTAAEPAPEAEPAQATAEGEATTPDPAAETPAEPVDETPPSHEAKFTRYHALVASLTIFILAIFIGFELITKVPPTLHTPLMSGSNAISGISIVGALIAASAGDSWLAAFIGLIAVILATINVVGGYLVTHRMLEMFKPKR